MVVPLGVGDSVINANDTLKLQRMGVLPKFHGGTKKKDWLDQLKGNIGKKAGNLELQLKTQRIISKKVQKKWLKRQAIKSKMVHLG